MRSKSKKMMMQPPLEARTTPGMEPDGSSNLECDFYMYLFKVQPCPKRGAHDWSSCPYAHLKEKARRRDPRVYKYVSTPCPESLQGINCGRGVDCPYAHSVYEYWLHPARFRTQMCKKGNQCNRTLCFFAHCASELRFPDTEDEAQAAAVDAAAASATAAPLPLYKHGLVSTGSSTAQQHAGLAMMQSVAGNSNNSLPLMQLGSMCSDASAATAALGTLDGSMGSYNMASLQVAASGMRQGSGGSQLTGLVDDMSGSYGLGSSDPGLLLQGLVNQQQHQHVQAQDCSNSLSEPLPRTGSDPNSLNAAAWLQLATASQLPASQILSSIRPPGMASVIAQQQQQLQQQQLQQQQLQQQQLQQQQLQQQQLQQQQQQQLQQHHMLHQAGGYTNLGQTQRPAMQMGRMPGNSAAMNNMMVLPGGSGSSSHPLVHKSMDSSAEQLVASLGGLQLQGMGDDGSSGLMSASTAALADRYAALTAAAGASGRPVDASMLQAAGAGSSRAENFMLLQLLQEKQVQQQQQVARLSNGGDSMGPGQNVQTCQGFSQVPVTAPQQPGRMNWGFGLGI